MLRYSRQKIEGLKLGHGKPKPFPGRWPTHVMCVWSNGRLYIGKPFQGIEKELVNPELCLLIEFDRANKVFVFSRPSNKFTAVDIVNSPRHFPLYHPLVLGGQLHKDVISASYWFQHVSCERVNNFPYYLAQPLAFIKSSAEEQVREMLKAEPPKPVGKKVSPKYGYKFKVGI